LRRALGLLDIEKRKPLGQTTFFPVSFNLKLVFQKGQEPIFTAISCIGNNEVLIYHHSLVLGSIKRPLDKQILCLRTRHIAYLPDKFFESFYSGAYLRKFTQILLIESLLKLSATACFFK